MPDVLTPDRTSPPRADRQTPSPLRHCSLPVLVTCLAGLAVTAGAVAYAHWASQAESGQRFRRLSERVIASIERRVNLPVYGLRGARGVFAASKSVERGEFQAYVDSRDLPGEFPGVLGFGWIRRVARSGLAEFEAAERADGAPDFSVRPVDQQAPRLNDLYVITNIQPLARNRAALGLDVGSEPRRREAAERAVMTGQPVITAAVGLVQDERQRVGFLYMVPVYANGPVPRTAEERMRRLSGILYAPIIIDEILDGVAADAEHNLDFEVFDGEVARPERKLFDHDQHLAAWSSGPVDSTMGRRSHFAYAPIYVGGRVWTVVTSTTPKFDAATHNLSKYLAAAIGTALTALLAGVFWALGRSRSKAVELAAAMTSDLARANEVAVEHASQVERHAAALASSADMLRRTGEMARVGGWEVDLASGVVSWTDEVYRIHGLAIGTYVTPERAMTFYCGEARTRVAAAVDAAIKDGVPWDLELPLVTAGGNAVWVHARGEPVYSGGAVTGLRGAFQDVTARREAEQQLRRSATHDRLTGLPNRALLADRLQQRLYRYARAPHRPFAVLFMDFDRFKLTNDTLGHEAGDELLRQIAQRLRASLRPSDSVSPAQPCGDIDPPAAGPTVGRLGGDEFVIVLDEISRPDDVKPVADRLLESLAAPYRVGGHDIVSTASIGIVVSGDQYTRPDEMLRDADIAMYEAKAAGKGRYVLFDKAMHERLERRVRTEAELRKAVEAPPGAEQLFLVYQPIVSLATGAVHGAEALLRWQHPTRGLVAPDELIPIAEETGLIVPIGDWVLRTACRQFQKWRDDLGPRAPASISVNLSRRQMAVGELPARVRQILDETGMLPGQLHLEVTESTVMKDPARSIRLMQELRQIGVRIAMDDFGTGHSSLAMLHQFPLDVLKIDKSFVASLGQGRQFAALVYAIVQLAHNLNMTVVAEGVERDDQVAMLQTVETEFAQGYYFSRPLKADAFHGFGGAARKPEAAPAADVRVVA